MGEICFKIIRQGDVMGVLMELIDFDMMIVGIVLSGGYYFIFFVCVYMKFFK